MQENACLTFLTPSTFVFPFGLRELYLFANIMYAALLAGDRTLVDVVVHELTHSWFGNGVT